MKATPRDTAYSLCGKIVSNIASNLIDGERMGYVKTPHGIVVVQTWEPHRPDELRTYLHFVWRGRSHHRQYAADFSDRGLSTLARRFAEDVVRKAPQTENKDSHAG